MFERFISFSFEKRSIFLVADKHAAILTWDGRHSDIRNKGLDMGVEGCCPNWSTEDS